MGRRRQVVHVRRRRDTGGGSEGGASQAVGGRSGRTAAWSPAVGQADRGHTLEYSGIHRSLAIWEQSAGKGSC